MQINFNPHRIKAAKAYIENLVEEEKTVEEKVVKIVKIEKGEDKSPTFFKRLKKLFFG